MMPKTGEWRGQSSVILMRAVVNLTVAGNKRTFLNSCLCFTRQEGEGVCVCVCSQSEPQDEAGFKV